MIRTHSQDRRQQRRNPVKTRRAEIEYSRSLRQVAEQVGALIGGFDFTHSARLEQILASLRRYSDLLTPWAESTASRMIASVNLSDQEAWRAHANEMSAELKQQLGNAPTGEAVRALLAEQVTLIKSIPLEAAQRVHELTIKGLSESSRGASIEREILKSGEVAKSRARLIARTEIQRTATALTKVRAEHIGSIGYIWRTTGDSDVRASHKQMNGKFVRWDSPPTLSDGTVTHAGGIYNCRCFPEPVFPQD
jgi:SPP1 gp7 family putative phage head morphogenesis protein